MAYKVIDISTFNSISSYNTLANTSIDGVIMRAGYRGYGSSGTLVTDSKFSAHYNGLHSNNPYLPLGVYFMSQAINESEAIAEANYVYNLIKSKDIKFPVYIDSEYSGASGNSGRADGLSKSARTTVCIAFCKRMKELGYKSGIYASDYWYYSKLDLSRIYSSGYVDSLWVAKYSSSAPSYVSTYDAWQYTSTGSVSGISGNVDISHFYKKVWESGSSLIDISTLNITLSPTSYTYNGSAKKPSVSISGLTKDTDYTVSYSNNVNAGTATVTIKGINNYTGTVTKTFTIKPATITGTVKISPTQSTYTGSAITPSVSISGLIKDTDYTVSYSNNINVGTGKVTCKGKGNYTGTLQGTFKIVSKAISGTITISKDLYKYTGSAITPSVSISGLTKDTDYTVSYTNNVNVGTATITCTGKGNYSGKLTKNFKISRMSMKYCKITISGNNNLIYTGKPITVVVTIVDTDINQTITDYTTSYSDNINAGTATVTCTGKGEYTDSISGTFIINPKNIYGTEYEIEGTYFKYNGNSIKPDVTLKGLEKDKDYTLSYSDNKIGINVVAVQGINNYTGFINAEYTIDYRDITECIGKLGFATIKSIYRVDGLLAIYTPDMSYKMAENTDYKILDIDRKAMDDFYLHSIEVKGLGGFSGSAILRFRIIDEEPDYEFDYEDDGAYNFGDIDEGDETAVGNYDFENPSPVLKSISVMSLENEEEIIEDSEELPDDEPEVVEDPSVVIDGSNYDFDGEWTTMWLADYDMDDGFNIYENGTSKYDDLIIKDNPDDGTYNFGDIDEGDETAVGDYDFGDLDEGVDSDTVAKDDYDFNKLAGDIDEWFMAGVEYNLADTPLYANYCSSTSVGERSGLYFIFSPIIMNNRIRVCQADQFIEVPCGYSGWVDIDDLINLGNPTVNDLVSVTGTMYKYANGTGGSTELEKSIMYITEYIPEYQYPYGVSSGYNTSRLGFVSRDSITIINRNSDK